MKIQSLFPFLSISRYSSNLVFLFLLAGLITILWYPFNDGDVWWHIAVGQEILQNHAIPTVDEWTFTANGHPYIYHSWLSDLLLAVIWHSLGNFGLEVLKVSIHLATCLYIFFLLRRFAKMSYSIGMTLIFAYWLSSCPIRPFIITPLFSLILMDWFYFDFRETRKRFISVLVLFLVWTNLHGSFPIGLIFLGLHTFVAVLGCVFHRVSESKMRWFLYLLLGSLLITLVNPYGILLYVNVLEGTQNASFDWMRIQILPLLNVSLVTAFALLISLLFAAWSVVRCVYTRQFEDFHRLLITLVCYYMALFARRLEWLLFFPLCLLFLYESSAIRSKKFAENRAWIRTFGSLVLIVGLTGFLLTQRISFAIMETDMLPESFVDYISTHSLEGNLFCPLTWSGRVTLASEGKLKIFIDGRLQLHPRKFFQDYLLFFMEKGLTPGQIKQYDIDYLLLPLVVYDQFIQSSAPILWKPIQVYDHGILLKRM